LRAGAFGGENRDGVGFLGRVVLDEGISGVWGGWGGRLGRGGGVERRGEAGVGVAEGVGFGRANGNCVFRFRRAVGGLRIGVETLERWTKRNSFGCVSLCVFR